MKKPLQLALFCCFLMINSLLIAQSEQHFRAGVAAGVNFSQINGDNQNGYHKVGVSVGAKGAYCFKPNFDMSAELLYNSRGSRPNPFESRESLKERSALMTATLNYADVLLAANFHFSPNSDYTFYRQSLQFGVSYGRLLSSNIQVLKGDAPNIALETTLQDQIRKDDLGFVAGYSWFLTARLGIMVKHTFSLRKIYVNPLKGAANQEYQGFTPYNFSLQLVYNFISPKLNVKAQVEKARKAAERRKKNPLEDL